MNEQADPGHPDDALWERVLCREASAAEQDRVNEHVLDCRACAELYRALLEVRREAAAFDPGVPASATAMPPASVSRRPFYLALAAAATIVLAIAGSLWTRNRPADVAQPVETRLASLEVFRIDKAPVELPASSVLTLRGEKDDRQRFLADLGHGLDAYRAGDFAAAADRLAGVAQAYPDRPEPAFFAAVSLLLIGKPSEAAAELDRVRASAPPEMADEIDWYLGLARVHAGTPGRAADLFVGLCQQPGPHQSRSCEAARAIATAR